MFVVLVPYGLLLLSSLFTTLSLLVLLSLLPSMNGMFIILISIRTVIISIFIITLASIVIARIVVMSVVVVVLDY